MRYRVAVGFYYDIFVQFSVVVKSCVSVKGYFFMFLPPWLFFFALFLFFVFFIATCVTLVNSGSILHEGDLWESLSFANKTCGVKSFLSPCFYSYTEGKSNLWLLIDLVCFSLDWVVLILKQHKKYSTFIFLLLSYKLYSLTFYAFNPI